MFFAAIITAGLVIAIGNIREEIEYMDWKKYLKNKEDEAIIWDMADAEIFIRDNQYAFFNTGAILICSQVRYAEYTTNSFDLFIRKWFRFRLFRRFYQDIFTLHNYVKHHLEKSWHNDQRKRLKIMFYFLRYGFNFKQIP